MLTSVQEKLWNMRLLEWQVRKPPALKEESTNEKQVGNSLAKSARWKQFQQIWFIFLFILYIDKLLL